MKNSTSRTHYRSVHKSDHLGVADLEEMVENKKALIFTIKQVKKEIEVSVAGIKGNHNIAYFKESIKPLVLNVVNSKVIKKFTNSSFLEDWGNTLIELYIDPNVKMKGEIVGGVRIRPSQPNLQKQDIKTTILNCKNLEELTVVWNSLDEKQQTTFKSQVIDKRTMLTPKTA